MSKTNGIIVQNAFIDDDNCIVAHLYHSMSGFTPILKLIQSSKKENYGLIEYVEINGKQRLARSLVISIDESSFSNYRIMFLMGLVWNLEFNFKSDLSIEDFYRIEAEGKIPIINYSFSYQSTSRSLKEIANDLYGLRTQIPKIRDEIASLKNLIYALGGLVALMLLLNYWNT